MNPEQALDEKLHLPAVGNETFREGARWERARIHREQAAAIAQLRLWPGGYLLADRLEEATRDA